MMLLGHFRESTSLPIRGRLVAFKRQTPGNCGFVLESFSDAQGVAHAF